MLVHHFFDVSRSRWPVLLLIAGCLLISANACTLPSTDSAGAGFRNDTIFFPLRAFSHVVAHRLDNASGGSPGPIFNADGNISARVTQPGQPLSPAHRADLVERR